MHASLSTTLAKIAISVPAYMAGITIHEFAHALTAVRLGDPTPQRLGRLTLNPAAHIDWLGVLCLLVFRVGWARPVVFNPYNFKHPRFYSILCALAGPLSNFILALISLYALAYLPLLELSAAAHLTFVQIFSALTYANIMLGVVNLLPIPSFDGSHLYMTFLRDKYPHVIDWLYRYGLFIFFVIFLLPQTQNFLYKLIMNTEAILKFFVF